MPTLLPAARRAELVIQETNDEILIFDKNRDRALVLNRTAAVIWNLADGETSVTDIARRASRALDVPLDPALVWYTLEQLSKKNLLESPVVPPGPHRDMTRRDFLRTGTVGAAVLLPVIVTLATPAVSHAASCIPDGQCCTTPSECCSNTCTADTCV